MKIDIIDIARHRNGICGAPFAVVLFEDAGQEGSCKIGILFDERHHCAVLDVAKLAAGDIAFASNSWRGDTFEPSLRAATADGEPVKLPDIDIHALLAERKEIAVTWSIEDVSGIRPDLSDEQCWEVLQQVKDIHDAEWGISWTTLETVAFDLFGRVPNPDEAGEV